MVTKLLLTCLLWCVFLPLMCEQPTAIVIENHNIIPTHATHTGDCTQLSGSQLIDCMCCLDPVQLVEQFMRINWRAALYYYHALTNAQKVELLTHLSDEQWSAWYARLPAYAHSQLCADRTTEMKQCTENMVLSARTAHKTALILATVIEWTLRIALR